MAVAALVPGCSLEVLEALIFASHGKNVFVLLRAKEPKPLGQPMRRGHSFCFVSKQQ